MSTIDLNYLGQFDSIDAVWAAHPEGGHEGDYLDIVDTRYRWNKYEQIWENANTVTQSPARKVDNIDGDLHVQNNLHVGGKLYASVKQPNCGLFSSLSALQAAYPHPEVGMWATIGDGIPGDIYRCDTAGEWTATGETGGADVLDITELREAIADLADDITEEANNRANGDSQLRTEMLAEGSVTTSRLADGAVSTSKIEDEAVTSRKLADQSVTNTKLAAGAHRQHTFRRISSWGWPGSFSYTPGSAGGWRWPDRCRPWTRGSKRQHAGSFLPGAFRPLPRSYARSDRPWNPAA